MPGKNCAVKVDTLANPSSGIEAARSTDAMGYLSDQSIDAANRPFVLGKTIPDRHQVGFSLRAPGNKRPLSAGVTVSASKRLMISITMTQVAKLPRKSPEGPSSIAMGVKARTVVAVALTSGTVIRFTAFCKASSGSSPRSRFFRTSSVTTIEPSTNRPSATTSPVSDS